MSQYVVCALYKFVELENYQELREPLLALMGSPRCTWNVATGE